MKPFAHINAVGSDMPGKTEQALAEGECQQLDLAEMGPPLPNLLQDPRSYVGLEASAGDPYDPYSLLPPDAVRFISAPRQV